MKRISFLAVLAVFLVSLTLIMASPQTAQAEVGCPDKDQLITAGSYFKLGWNCNASGDVAMRKNSSEGYQRLYDDDDASTGLIVRCTDISGCGVYAKYGGYVSARNVNTMVADTFTYVPGLRYIDTKCYPVDCGVTRHFPSGNTVVIRSPAVTSPPAVLPPAFPGVQVVESGGFSAGVSVLALGGGFIWIDGVGTFYRCWFPFTPSGGTGRFLVFWPPVPPGAPLCQ